MKSLKVLELNNISKSHDKTIIENVNLCVHQGEFVIITGPSGCGKSTLLQILGLLEPATSGEYYLGNNLVNHCTPNKLSKFRQEYIGFVFQRYHLIEHLTVLDNVLLPAQYGNIDKQPEDAYALLKRFAVEEHANKHPSQLSYGQQQRVAIARAIIMNPRVILADEPTGSLDDENANIVMKELRNLNNEGQTIILITHNLHLIEKSDTHYIIKNRQLVRQ